MPVNFLHLRYLLTITNNILFDTNIIIINIIQFSISLMI